MQRVCDICGNVEPIPWFEQPMNETIREYARSYIGPPKTFNISLAAELDVWGIDWRSWDDVSTEISKEGQK